VCVRCNWLQASEGTSERYQVLMDLFEELSLCLSGINFRVIGAANTSMRSVVDRLAVDIVIHIFTTVALVLRLLDPSSKSRAGAYVADRVSHVSLIVEITSRARRVLAELARA
jgi:hypothetical protein